MRKKKVWWFGFSEKEKGNESQKMWNHISTYVLIATLLSLLLPRPEAWSFLAPLLMLCTWIVPFAAGCSYKEKYAIMCLKLLVIGAGLARFYKRTIFSPLLFGIAVLVAGTYAWLVDLDATYGCSPTLAQMAGTVAASGAAYASLAFLLR